MYDAKLINHSRALTFYILQLEFLEQYHLDVLHVVNGEAPPIDPSFPGTKYDTHRNYSFILTMFRLLIGLRMDVASASYRALFRKLARNVTVDYVECAKVSATS